MEYALYIGDNITADNINKFVLSKLDKTDDGFEFDKQGVFNYHKPDSKEFAELIGKDGVIKLWPDESSMLNNIIDSHGVVLIMGGVTEAMELTDFCIRNKVGFRVFPTEEIFDFNFLQE